MSNCVFLEQFGHCQSDKLLETPYQLFRNMTILFYRYMSVGVLCKFDLQ